ncbi:hypothetical protein B0G71_1386 [Paraburkholderia sp. BL27I4N3]|uniref:hypothetical protein n=1 Tax=Paraburkholderia sp. BL27I4N3 TaxID=1938805 RepID=UPI000E239C4E|nr:hypothetical protein [Paraburkholderia sp. BL27I4N3]REE18374.1 hypothetical protein B0G71_1386 [Paraburkholderia sp. BL27I4N3]
MTHPDERIVGTILFMLSGFSFAGGLVVDSHEEMTVENIAPLQLELAPPIPGPQRYLQRYEMEYQSSQGGPFYPQSENFYSAQVTHDFRFGAGRTTTAPEVAPPASDSFHIGSSTARHLSIVDLPNATLAIGSQPQRRLSLTVDDWDFSATARVAVLHSHSTGATLSVRHGF